MTFIIRQITRRPGGQDIIRDRQHDGEEITVGRATNNDIFLSDLRVGLDHLTIYLSGSRLIVEATPDHPFLVKGRQQSKLNLNHGQSAAIQVGPFELQFDQNEERLWRVTVERVEPEEALFEDDVDDIFSLRGTILSKRGPAWIGFLAVVLVFLAAPVAWFYGVLPEQSAEVVDLDSSWLSGPLSDPHSNLGTECEACHVDAFEHVNDSACIECHDALGDHADPVMMAQSQPEFGGVKGAMLQTASFFGKEQGECADCHREHNGNEGIILSNSVLCTDCHVGLSGRVASALEDVDSFADLHPNFQATVVKTPGDDPVLQRVALGQPGAMDNSGLLFPHDIHLKPSGEVANQAQKLGAQYGFGESLVCADCHEPDKDGLLFKPVEMEANCQMCHSLDLPDETYARELPHGKPQEVIALIRDYYRNRTITDLIEPDGSVRRRPGSSSRVRQQPRRETAAVDAATIANEQVAMIFDDKGSCGICHEVIEPAPGTVAYDIVPVTLIDSFMTRAHFDHESHEIGELTCDSCHEAKWSSLASDILLPEIETVAGLPGGGEVIGCRDCHGDEDSRAPLVASACLDCHGYHDGIHAPLMTAGKRSGPHGELANVTSGTPAFSPARWGRLPESDTFR